MIATRTPDHGDLRPGRSRQCSGPPGYRRPAPPPFPDPGETLERLEEAGFDLAEDSVRTVVQRRAFTREQLVGLLRTQAVLVLTRHADAEQAGAITEQAVAAVDRLRRHDGSYDQTFVRLELLAHRPGLSTLGSSSRHG